MEYSIPKSSVKTNGGLLDKEQMKRIVVDPGYAAISKMAKQLEV
jgi:hypothetical protein